MAWTVFDGAGADVTYDNIELLGGADIGFYIDGSNHKITNCRANSVNGVEVNSTNTRLGISNSTFTGEIHLGTAREVEISGTLCARLTAGAASDLNIQVQMIDANNSFPYPVILTGATDVKLEVHSRYGVHLDGVVGFEVRGFIGGAREHGLLLEDCIRGVDNTVIHGASQVTDNAFQGKRVTAGCSNLKIGGSVKHAGLTNKPDYGMQVDDGATNIEVDCHLVDSGDSGEINNLAGFEVWTHARISTETPNDNDVPVWDAANGIYRPEAGGGGGGGLDLTTKGDLHTYDTDDAALGVGANGEALFADSVTGTGLDWRLIVEADISDLDHTDPSAIHDDVAGEIAALTQVTPAVADHLLIEDASDTNNKKRIEVGDLSGVGGSDADAIHDNVAAEISAITQKVTPVDADVILIEDSADSFAKKYVEIGDLPSSGGGGVTNPPPTTGWSWVNQGSAVETQIGDSLVVKSPAVGSANLITRVRAAPSTPYSILGKVMGASPATHGGFGLCFRESSTGKITLIYLKRPGNLLVEHWTNATTFSSTPVNSLAFPGAKSWFRIEDNGTNLFFSVGPIGDDAGVIQMATHSRTSFMAGGPNEVGFIGRDESAVLVFGLEEWIEQ